MSSSAGQSPSPKVAPVARAGSIVANVASVLILLTMGYAWILDRRTLYLVIALSAAFSLVVSIILKLHARRSRIR
jgi:hypothetical protein